MSAPIASNHPYQMESPLNGYYIECAFRFEDGSVCHKDRTDPCHVSAATATLACVGLQHDAECGQPIAWFDAGPMSGWIHTDLDGGEWNHKAQPPAPPPKTPRVLFCPFCGGGTLLMGKDPQLWECLKCRRTFGVSVKL